MIQTAARVLEVSARYGKWVLVAGLLCGLFLPGLASAMRPWLPYMVAFLLAVTGFRVGFHEAVGRLAQGGSVLFEAAALQVALPLFAAVLFLVTGVLHTTPALAIVLMLSAPSISGSANFSALVGGNPAPAMQLLVLGTVIFPATVLPVLLLAGTTESAAEVLMTAMRLAVVIAVSTGIGFAARAIWVPDATQEQLRRADGAGVLTLAIVVIGLMAGIGPVLSSDPPQLLGWLALVFGANFGLQVLAFFAQRKRAETDRRIPVSIVAGNRNVALFLFALPPALVDELLIFIGCYQLPMYLTPLLLGRLYKS